jgi:hypothetical protein
MALMFSSTRCTTGKALLIIVSTAWMPNVREQLDRCEGSMLNLKLLLDGLHLRVELSVV